MTKRYTISATDEADREIDLRADEGERSATISRTILRYAEVCRRHLPALSELEWRLVMECAQPESIVEDAGRLTTLWAEGYDLVRRRKESRQRSGLPPIGEEEEEWRVGDALALRLRDLPYAEIMAIVDESERRWRREEERS